MSSYAWEVRNGGSDGSVIAVGYRHPPGRELRPRAVIRLWGKPWRVIGWRRAERVLVVESV
jgi:hypothetical protein